MKNNQKHRKVDVRVGAGGLAIMVPGWNGFKLGPGRCRVVLDGKTISLRLEHVAVKNGRTVLRWNSRVVAVEQEFASEQPGWMRWKSSLTYHGRTPATLDRVELWSTAGVPAAVIDLGRRPERVRVLENSG